MENNSEGKRLNLNESDLITRLKCTEDPYVERKGRNDIRDILKTAVAFTNSLPIGAPGVIFFPADNQGNTQDGVDLDKAQKEITNRLSRAYPPLPFTYKVCRSEGKEIIACVVWGSEERPHFSGQAFIRDGSQTLPASKEKFEELIHMRSSKIREILKWKGKQVVVGGPGFQEHLHKQGTLLDCNQFWVTISMPNGERAFPLSKICLSIVPSTKMLYLEVYERPISHTD